MAAVAGLDVGDDTGFNCKGFANRERPFEMPDVKPDGKASETISFHLGLW